MMVRCIGLCLCPNVFPMYVSQCIASLDMQGSYIVVIATQLVLPFEMTSIYLYWIVCSKNLNEDGVCMLMKTEATARL